MRFVSSCFALCAALALWGVPQVAHAAKPSCGIRNKSGAKVCSIDPRIDRQAVCADGTVPAYWYRPGFGTGANTWLIWLGGGGSCDSPGYCSVWVTKEGVPAFLTSTGFLPTPGKGITSSDSSTNPSLYNANTIYLHYCSADNWTGEKAGSGAGFSLNDTTTWNFEGRPVAVAGIKSLDEFYPALATASTIIVGGDSSGGAGAVEVANDILPLLPAAPQKLLVVDAGFALDIGDFDQLAPPSFVNPATPTFFETDTQQRLSFWNARGDAVCAASATTPQQQGNCYNTAYILENGYINVPTFVAEALLDTSQITFQLCPSEYGYCEFGRNPRTPPGVYETNFGAGMTAALIGAGTPAPYTIYAPDVLMHVILNDDDAFTIPRQFPQGDIAPRDVLDAWLADPTQPKASFIGTGPGVAPK
jgi:hypothetical protein